MFIFKSPKYHEITSDECIYYYVFVYAPTECWTKVDLYFKEKKRVMFVMFSGIFHLIGAPKHHTMKHKKKHKVEGKTQQLMMITWGGVKIFLYTQMEIFYRK